AEDAARALRARRAARVGHAGRVVTLNRRCPKGLAVIAVCTRRALPLAAPVLYFAAIRPQLLGWGASGQERRQSLPGDDLVPARWQTTRAITISAPAEEVWPWLVQMGYSRGGWYSYDWLEHLIGAGDFVEGGSARRVVP